MANLKDLIVSGSARILGTIYGNLTGNVTGNVSGSAGSCTGNAATATKATQDGSGNVIATYYEPKANVTSKGSATKPVYFNSSGVATAITSYEGNSATATKATTIVDQNNTSTVLKTWTGTKAQYDAITTKDSNTLYNITDDTDTTLSLLETIYPVGSLYLTTASSCPLAALFGTWQLVANDKVLQGAGSRGSVGSTLDESLPNIKGSAGYILPNSSLATQKSSTSAFGWSGTSTSNLTSTTSGTANTFDLILDASNSSSTYQDNAPVQQDAYLIAVYRRVA